MSLIGVAEKVHKGGQIIVSALFPKYMRYNFLILNNVYFVFWNWKENFILTLTNKTFCTHTTNFFVKHAIKFASASLESYASTVNVTNNIFYLIDY